MSRKVTKYWLKPGDPIPSWKPKRYIDSSGYVLLRWYLYPNTYIECTEHRIKAGIPDGHVHHVDQVKTNNRNKNLEILSPEDHAAHHASLRHIDDDKAAWLYSMGYKVKDVANHLGVTESATSRALKRAGVSVDHTAPNKMYLDPEAIIAMDAIGIPPREIAKRLGCSDTPIRRILKEAGVKPQIVGRRPKVHGTLRGADAPHGSTIRYKRGCHCDPCRAANTERERNRRKGAL